MSVLRSCAVLVLSAAAAYAAAGFEQIVQGPTGLALAAAGGRAAVLAPPGAAGAASVRLPPGARLSAVAELEGGWLAAGIRSAPDGGQEIFLALQDAGAGRALPAPAGRRGGVRSNPVPLVGDRELRGMAWLEGDGQAALGVWAAAWEGARWGPAQLVSPPRGGSQLALAGAVLDQGSWLLAWSGWDGNDDEILWSLRRQESWSAPRRAAPDNEVPDVTPTLVASAGGALLAWSRYDGNDYRLILAGFAGDGWSEIRIMGGPGSGFPSFVRSGDRPVLLHRTARPLGWFVHELDPAGRILRWAVAGAASPERPAFIGATGGPDHLVWPGGRALDVSWQPGP